MPKVTVRAFATLNGLLGSKTMDVFTLGPTIRELIDLIATEYNPQFKDRLIDPKKARFINSTEYSLTVGILIFWIDWKQN